jgi:hypothetical protein
MSKSTGRIHFPRNVFRGRSDEKGMAYSLARYLHLFAPMTKIGRLGSVTPGTSDRSPRSHLIGNKPNGAAFWKNVALIARASPVRALFTV